MIQSERLLDRERGMRWACGGLVLLLFVGSAEGATVGSAEKGLRPACVGIREDRALGLHWRRETQSGGRPARWIPMTEDEAVACRRQLLTETAAIDAKLIEGTQEGAKPDLKPQGLAVTAAHPVTASLFAASPVAVKPVAASPIAVRPVIQVGDHVVVIQSAGGVLARLPGVALAAAAKGQRLPVRLQVGNGGFGKASGRVVQTQAVTAGMAQWDGAMEWRGAGW